MDRVLEALDEIRKAAEDFNRRLTKQEDRMNGLGLKVAALIGGCIVISALVPIVVIFLERVAIK
ncbi:MAG: hypothetical protein WBD81_18050 [Collimonas pratensis]|uniref:hypothetical protein n=1 Tax=Collimonas pratensis TaxID=279113 RepID=UPI003C73F65C